MPRGISTFDEELIGTEASRFVTKFLDGSYLLLIVEDVMHDELCVEGQLVAHVEPMVEEDEQPSFGPTIDEEQTNAQVSNRVVVLSYNIVLKEYIDRSCNMVFPLLSILERGVGFPKWIFFIA